MVDFKQKTLGSQTYTVPKILHKKYYIYKENLKLRYSGRLDSAALPSVTFPIKFAFLPSLVRHYARIYLPTSLICMPRWNIKNILIQIIQQKEQIKLRD